MRFLYSVFGRCTVHNHLFLNPQNQLHTHIQMTSKRFQYFFFHSIYFKPMALDMLEERLQNFFCEGYVRSMPIPRIFDICSISSFPPMDPIDIF